MESNFFFSLLNLIQGGSILVLISLIAGGIILFLIIIYWRKYTDRKLKTFKKEWEKKQSEEKSDPIKECVLINNIREPESELIKRALDQLKNSPKTDNQSSKKEFKETIAGKGSQTQEADKPKTQIIASKKTLKEEQKPLPYAVNETENEVKDILNVNYKCNLEEKTDTYPILRLPKFGCVIRSHRNGSTKRRGFKDADLQRAIEICFSDAFTILGDARLNTGKNTRPFEPDIAMISNGLTKNIRIDIEIDEPYAGISRQATHCKGDDFHRDTYFVDRGWIVIRFSEYQVHTQEKFCLLFIAKLIKSIDPVFVVPEKLLTYESIIVEPAWDIVQAQKWEKQKYREKYLGHEFLPLPEKQETVERELNAQERKEEKQVIPTSIGTPESNESAGYNKKNAHSRDKRIRFYPEPHVYTVDNKPIPSASTIVSRFFPEFDTEYWSEQKAFSMGMTAEEVALKWKTNGENAANAGTWLHQQIENYYLGVSYNEPKEFEHFKSFVRDHDALKPHRTEWRVFDEKHGFAGTIDFITLNGNGFEIYDWKRSKKIMDSNFRPITENSYQSGIGPLSHIPDTSFNRYCIQQNLYKYILQENYQIIVSSMFLVVLHPNLNNYYKLKVPDMRDEINSLIKVI